MCDRVFTPPESRQMVSLMETQLKDGCLEQFCELLGAPTFLGGAATHSVGWEI